jgi:hypothetical protein
MALRSVMSAVFRKASDGGTLTRNKFCFRVQDLFPVLSGATGSAGFASTCGDAL